MEDLTPFRKESPDVGTSIHGLAENTRVLVGWLGLFDQAPQHTSESHSLVHGAARGGRGQCLEVEGEVVLDRGTILDRLDFQGSTNVGQRRGAEWKRLGMVLLPSLIFGPELKGARVLKIGGQHNGLVTGLTGKLNAQVPSFERDENEVKVIREQVFGGKGVETVDGIPESARIPDVFPCESGQAR